MSKATQAYKQKQYEINIDGQQRWALYQCFIGAQNTKERENRRAVDYAWDALGFDDFKNLEKEIPEGSVCEKCGNSSMNMRDVRKAERDFGDQLDKIGGTWIVGIDTVNTALDVIDSVFKAGGIRGGLAIRRLTPVEELFEACKRGEHVYVAEDKSNGSATVEKTDVAAV